MNSEYQGGGEMEAQIKWAVEKGYKEIAKKEYMYESVKGGIFHIINLSGEHWQPSIDDLNSIHEEFLKNALLVNCVPENENLYDKIEEIHEKAKYEQTDIYDMGC